MQNRLLFEGPFPTMVKFHLMFPVLEVPSLAAYTFLIGNEREAINIDRLTSLNGQLHWIV